MSMAAKVKWPTKRLSELAEFRNGVNYNKSSFGVGIKVVGVSDFQDYTKPRYAELEQINPEGIVTERNILRDGDIVFVRSNGNRELIGRSLFIEQPPEEVTHSAFSIRLRFTTGEVHPKFYAYCFRTPLIRQALTAQGGGTNINNLNQDILNALEVPVPPLPVQRRIAGILSAYDELIENSQRRIRLLEDLARALYREWFVHFRFPGHESVPRLPSTLGDIPQGWEVKRLGDLISNNRRATKPGPHLDERRYVPIDCLPSKSLALLEAKPIEEAQSSLQLFEKGDILFGAMRPYFHKVVVAPFAGVTRTTCFVFKPARREWHAFAVMTAFEESTVAYANAHSQGATIPYAVWDGSLSEMPLVLPPDAMLRRFEKAVAPMLARISQSFFALKNLRQTRDLLLPRLLSGQVVLADTSN
jgi:type I restriction enzyme S subunit